MSYSSRRYPSNWTATNRVWKTDLLLFMLSIWTG